MDSQTSGALVAAVITAIAGLVGVAMTRRRTSFRHDELLNMREEAELLAALPEGHPGRERLSDVLDARLTGYVRMFDLSVRRPRSPLLPYVCVLAGMVMMFFVILGEGDSAIWGLFGPDGVTKSGGDWWTRRDDGWTYLTVFTVGLLLYASGLHLANRRILPWKWARAMRGDRIRPLPTRSETARAMSWLWSHVASAARWVRSSLWRKDGQDPANGDPR